MMSLRPLLFAKLRSSSGSQFSSRWSWRWSPPRCAPPPSRSSSSPWTRSSYSVPCLLLCDLLHEHHTSSSCWFPNNLYSPHRSVATFQWWSTHWRSPLATITGRSLSCSCFLCFLKTNKQMYHGLGTNNLFTQIWLTITREQLWPPVVGIVIITTSSSSPTSSSSSSPGRLWASCGLAVLPSPLYSSSWPLCPSAELKGKLRN